MQLMIAKLGIVVSDMTIFKHKGALEMDTAALDIFNGELLTHQATHITGILSLKATHMTEKYETARKTFALQHKGKRVRCSPFY